MVDNVELKENIERVNNKLDALRADFNKYKLDEEKSKASNFKAGVVFMGGILLSVIGYVIHNFVQFAGK